MRVIVPYGSVEEALRGLDNGGGLLDVLSRAGDGVIDRRELVHAAGHAAPDLLPALFLEIATSRLSETDVAAVRSRLSETLTRRVGAERPPVIAPSRFAARAEIGRGCLVAGVATRRRPSEELGRYTRPGLAARGGGPRSLGELPVLEDHDLVELAEAPGDADGGCQALVRRRESDAMRGAVLVAGVAVRYVFRRGEAQAPERLVLLPAFCASLDPRRDNTLDPPPRGA
jgi:hypothetical protein